MIPPARAALLSRLLLLTLVFALPLAVLPGGNDYVMKPKMTAVLIGALALAGFALAGGRADRSRSHPAAFPGALWLAVGALSSTGAVNGFQAARLFAQQTGWLLLFLEGSSIPVAAGRLSGALTLSLAGQLTVALLQMSGRWYVGHGELFGPGRIYATLGNPSFMGVYLAPVAAWLLVGLLSAVAAGRRRALWLGPALGAALFLMYQSQVIDAWAGLALGGAAGVALLRPRSRPWFLGGLAVLVVGGVFALGLLVPRAHDRLDYLKVKMFSWHAAAWLWRDRPLLGAGPGGFQAEAPLVMARVHALWTRAWKIPETFVAPHDEAFAHQDFLQMLAEGGVVGAGLWCWLVVVAIRAGRAGPWEEKAAGLAALSAFIPTMAFHFPQHLAASALMFWLPLGRVAGAARAGSWTPPASRMPSSPLFRGLVLVLTVGLCAVAARGLTTDVLLRGGYDRFRGGAPVQAVPFFERFERLDARDYEERFYAGALYQALGDHARALDGYERAIALYPGMQGAWYNEGNAAFSRGRYEEAIRCFTGALAINPCLVEAVNNRGNAYASLERHAEAERDYLRALELKPGYPDALYNLAADAWRQRRRAGATRWLRLALAADPRNAAARELARAMGVRVP